MFGKPSERDVAKAERYKRWVVERDPYAIASLVLGVFSLIELGALFIFGLAGIVLGVVAIRRIDRASAPAVKGVWLARFGITLSVVSLVIAIALYAYPRA